MRSSPLTYSTPTKGERSLSFGTAPILAKNLNLWQFTPNNGQVTQKKVKEIGPSRPLIDM
jgi:hypothetical protein